MTIPATTPGASELDEEEDLDKGEEGEKTDEGAEEEEVEGVVEGVVGREEPPLHDVIEYKAELSDKEEACELNVHVVVNGNT